ncbi:MAG: protein kinase [Proteobacteria bacterium]|nr:protein kinase [Pseudomonadota bacterium]
MVGPEEKTLEGGRYRVDGVIGQGGMALVYLVHHQQLQTPFALKVLRDAGANSQRLLQEGRAQAQLRHPNLVPVVDAIHVGGRPALVMEYVRGPSLERVIGTHPFTLSQVDDLARGLLDGMAQAHSQGFIHRDLKPANVLLDTTGAGVRPRIADFGLVKEIDSIGQAGGTRTGAVMGTPAYMAPEQIRDAARVDERADVFALGAILYELLTQRRAFAGDDAFELFEAIVYGRYRPVEEHVDGIPERMRVAIAAALHGDRDARPANVLALRELWTADSPAPTDCWDQSSVQAIRGLTPTVEDADEAMWGSLEDSREGAGWAGLAMQSIPGADDGLVAGHGLIGGALAGVLLWFVGLGSLDPAFGFVHLPFEARLLGFLAALVVLSLAAGRAALRGLGSPVANGISTGAFGATCAWLLGALPTLGAHVLTSNRLDDTVELRRSLRQATSQGFADDLRSSTWELVAQAGVLNTVFTFWLAVGCGALLGALAGVFAGARRDRETLHAPWHPVLTGLWGVSMQVWCTLVLSVVLMLTNSDPDLGDSAWSRSFFGSAVGAGIRWGAAISVGLAWLSGVVSAWSSISQDWRDESTRARGNATVVGCLLALAFAVWGVLGTGYAPAFLATTVAAGAVHGGGMIWASLSRHRAERPTPFDVGSAAALVAFGGVGASTALLGAGAGGAGIVVANFTRTLSVEPPWVSALGVGAVRDVMLHSWSAALLVGAFVALPTGLAVAALAWRRRRSVRLLALPLLSAAALWLGLTGLTRQPAELERATLEVPIRRVAYAPVPEGTTAVRLENTALAEVSLRQAGLRVIGRERGETAVYFTVGDETIERGILVTASIDDPSEAIHIELGMAAIIPIPKEANASVMTDDPTVAQVNAQGGPTLQLNARSLGTTSLTFEAPDGRFVEHDVLVYAHEDGQTHPPPHQAEVDCCQRVRVALDEEVAVGMPRNAKGIAMVDSTIAGVRMLTADPTPDGLERPPMLAIKGLSLGRTMLVVRSSEQAPTLYVIEVVDPATPTIDVVVGMGTVVARTEARIGNTELATVTELGDGEWVIEGLARGWTNLWSEGPRGEAVQEHLWVHPNNEAEPTHRAEVTTRQVTAVMDEPLLVDAPVWVEAVYATEGVDVKLGERASLDDGTRSRPLTVTSGRSGRVTVVGTGKGQPVVWTVTVSR